jgi:hypothetical protein
MTGVIFNPLQFFTCFVICPSVSRWFFLYFISAAVILLASLALMVQISLPYKKYGKACVLYIIFSCFI